MHCVYQIHQPIKHCQTQIYMVFMALHSSNLGTFKTSPSLIPSQSILILSAPTSSKLIPQPCLLSPTSHNHITPTTASHQFTTEAQDWLCWDIGIRCLLIVHKDFITSTLNNVSLPISVIDLYIFNVFRLNTCWWNSYTRQYFDGEVQDCNIFSTSGIEILQSCIKPLIYGFIYGHCNNQIPCTFCGVQSLEC